MEKENGYGKEKDGEKKTKVKSKKKSIGIYVIHKEINLLFHMLLGYFMGYIVTCAYAHVISNIYNP